MNLPSTIFENVCKPAWKYPLHTLSFLIALGASAKIYVLITNSVPLSETWLSKVIEENSPWLVSMSAIYAITCVVLFILGLPWYITAKKENLPWEVFGLMINILSFYLPTAYFACSVGLCPPEIISVWCPFSPTTITEILSKGCCFIVSCVTASVVVFAFWERFCS